MKNIKRIILSLFLSTILSSNIFMPEQQYAAIENPEYLPITEYQSSLSKMIARVMSLFSYKKSTPETKIMIATAAKSTIKPVVKVAAKQEVKQLTRLEAIEKIRHITTQLFDDTDVNHITFHLAKMKKLTTYLDEKEDKKLITAINFLIANHHRSSITDTLFWMKAVKELELDTIIPMTPETAAKTKAAKMKALNKKMRAGN